MDKKQKIYQGIMALILTLSLLAPAALQAGSQPAPMHPLLTQIAAETPDEIVPVIVLKNDKTDQAERAAEKLGGIILQDLYLINAFSAQMPAKAIRQLAKTASVNWVTLDGPITSTTENVEQETYYLFNNPLTPTGDTVAQAVLPLETEQPPKVALYNYDADRDSSTGLTIQRGGSGAFESDPAKIQRWQTSPFTDDYNVAATIRLKPYAAMQDFQPGLTGKINAYLIDRDGTSATVVADASFELNPWPENWARKTLDFNRVEYVFPAGHQLELAVTVDGSSGGDMMFSYGTNSQPAHLIISQRFDIPVVYLDTIGAPIVWAQGYEADDVTVAVIDSGTRTNPKGLKEKTGSRNRFVAKVSVRADTDEWRDKFGHGTYVAGLIGSNGRQSNGQYMGVAPEVDFAGIRVNDDYGMAVESDVVAGLQWVFENKEAYDIRVVNLSLTGNVAQPYHQSPLDLALEILWFNNITVVVASGNNGDDDPGVIYPPANDPFAIVIGATDDMATADPVDDTLAAFSAFGSTSEGFFKPDLSAPGVNLVSSMHSQSNFRWDYNAHVIQTAGSGGGYANTHFKASGTSAAAAIVSGAVALLLDAVPDLTPNQVKYLLMETATPLPGVEGAGAGLLNVANLVSTAQSYSDPADVPSANDNTMPHEVLAKMALIAYWASVNGGETIDWSSVNWNAVNWNAVNWNAVNWNAVNWNAVNWNAVNWNAVNWNAVNWNAVNWNAVSWNAVSWNAVNWNAVSWNAVNWNSIDMDY
jgi:serine protease AprX